MFFQQNLVKILRGYILNNEQGLTHKEFVVHVVNLGCFTRINYFWWKLGYGTWGSEKLSRLVNLHIGYCKEHGYFDDKKGTAVLTIPANGDKFLSFGGFIDEYRKRRSRYFHLILWILGSNLLLQGITYLLFFYKN